MRIEKMNDEVRDSNIVWNGDIYEGSSQVIPVSANYQYFEKEGRGFVLEETHRGLIRMYNLGTAGLGENLNLLTEDGRDILTSGDRQSRYDTYSNQPIVVDTRDMPTSIPS